MHAYKPKYERDLHWMKLALEQAASAANMQEVPVGAVVIAADNKTVLGQAHNRTISNHDPSAHAEILAIRQAAQTLQNYRLEGCTVYITIEPCAMCSAAMINARVARVVYAVADSKTGAAGSVLNLFEQKQLNHHTEITQLQSYQLPAEVKKIKQECLQQLQYFFNQRRSDKYKKSQQPKYAPLRDDAVRTDERNFNSVPTIVALREYSKWCLINDGNKAPWRMHYWDTNTKASSNSVVILLHGYSSYSLLWAKVLPQLKEQGWRVLTPDFLGFGQSDKPKKTAQHSLDWHTYILKEWLQTIDITNAANITVVACDSSVQLIPSIMTNLPVNIKKYALSLMPEPIKNQPKEHWRVQCQRKKTFCLDEHWALNRSEHQSKEWSTPFTDAGYKAALCSDFWADYPVDDTKEPYKNYQIKVLHTPDSGKKLRHWIDVHIVSLLNTYKT